MKATDSHRRIMTGVRSGAFYFNPRTGDIDLDVVDEGEEKKSVSVKCSPAQSIVFKAQRSRGKRIVAPEGEALTEGTYELPSGIKYVRVEITDETGKKAWSNPFFFEFSL